MLIKKWILGVALATTITSSYAGILGDLNTMFMSNQTPSGNFTTKDRQGVFGGSYFMRSPIQNINLVSFSPPRLQSGCGGADLFGGAFSFISSDQLVALFRNVAANAVGLAFKAAIKYISPGLDQLMTEFQSLLQKMNNLAKNSCALAHLIVDPAEKAIGSALDGEGSTGSAQNGLFTDAFAGATSFLKDANDYLFKAGASNPIVGNQTMKAIVNSGISNMLGASGLGNPDGSSDDSSNPNSLNNRVLVSLMGYSIGGIPCSSAPAGAPATPSQGANALPPVECQGPPLIKLEDFILGGGTGSQRSDIPWKLYKCINTNGADYGGTDEQICTQMQPENYAYPGMRAWINLQLYGTADGASVTSDSILGKMAGGTPNGVQYTPAQKQFVRFAPSPLMMFLTRVTDQNQRLIIAEKMRSPLEHCMAAELGRSLYVAANSTRINNEFKFAPITEEAIKDLRKDYMKYQAQCTGDNTPLQLAQYLDAVTHLTTKSNR